LSDSGGADLVSRHDLGALEMKLDASFGSLRRELSLVDRMSGLLLAGVAAPILRAFFPG
jgi:hypothetical protein